MGCTEHEIADGADDGREIVSTGAVSLTLTTHEVGADRIIGLRFALCIPQGSDITAAHVRFFAKSGVTESVAVKYRAEDIDNSPAFTTGANDFSGRTKTTAEVLDAPAAWTDEEYNDGPDISAVLQEVIDRAGWAPGNALSIFVEDNSSASQRVAAAFEHADAKPPQLHVNFLPPHGAVEVLLM